MTDALDRNGYIVWPHGDTGVHTCRVYKRLGEARDAAREKADLHNRPYEIRPAYESQAIVIEIVKPRRRK